jgi:hypothetical protein
LTALLGPGDSYFVFRSISLPVECKSKNPSKRFDCDNPEQNDTCTHPYFSAPIAKGGNGMKGGDGLKGGKAIVDFWGHV